MQAYELDVTDVSREACIECLQNLAARCLLWQQGLYSGMVVKVDMDLTRKDS